MIPFPQAPPGQVRLAENLPWEDAPPDAVPQDPRLAVSCANEMSSVRCGHVADHGGGLVSQAAWSPVSDGESTSSGGKCVSGGGGSTKCATDKRGGPPPSIDSKGVHRSGPWRRPIDHGHPQSARKVLDEEVILSRSSDGRLPPYLDQAGLRPQALPQQRTGAHGGRDHDAVRCVKVGRPISPGACKLPAQPFRDPTVAPSMKERWKRKKTAIGGMTA